MVEPMNMAIEQLRNGRMVILVDDEDRENEGDLVLPAEFTTPEAINFMATHARGLICLTLQADRVEQLGLAMMTSNNRSGKGTAFTVSIEAREGVTTGISAFDRAHTVRTAVDPSKGAADIVSPGHIFPLRAVPGGVLVRAGHTEGSIDLCQLAGLHGSAVICEIMREDGTMARMPDLKSFAEKFQLPIVTIQQVIARRMEQETLVDEVARTRLPSSFSTGEFELRAFKSRIDGTEHVALVKGPLTGTPLVRMHSECLTGDALGSLRCDCGAQLQQALRQIDESGNGALVYLRKHEGRGIGLTAKIQAYALQDQGMDTVEANRHLGFQADLRDYGTGAQVLRLLGIREMNLLTNNPRKVVGLAGYGIKIVDRVPIEIPANPHNQRYLATKRDVLGHELSSTLPGKKK